MEVRRNERLGLLEVWVPRSERGLEATQRQLNALCADGLRRGLDPVEILLRLR